MNSIEKIKSDALYEIKHIIFKAFNHDVKYFDLEDYYIKIYRPKEDDNDKSYISINRRKIYDFLNDGYYASTGQNFEGCDSSSDLKRKSVEIKIAYQTGTDEMIAVSVYSGYLGGQKCVGLTATLEPSLRELGKDAVKEIIKYDVNFQDKFYWCECSDAIEHYYEKFDGFRIPSIYATEILNIPLDTEHPIEFIDDGYHYRRYSKSLERYFQKIIYGFNSPETFNKIIDKETEEYKRYISRIENKTINEDYRMPSKMEIAFEIVRFFYIMTHDGVQFYPPYAIDKLKEYVDFIKSELDRKCHYSRYSQEEIEECYEDGLELLEYCCPLELHLFE